MTMSNLKFILCPGQTQMKPIYLLYAVLIGLSPLIVGELVAQVDPHSPYAYIPWYTFLTLPISIILGLTLAIVR